MPRADYYCRLWACPFYIRSVRGCVYCEGGKVSSRDEDKLKAKIKRHCANVQGWKDCPLARATAARYEQEDENGT